MNFKNIMRDHIIKDVFTLYNSGWFVLVYDKDVGEIVHYLFSRSDMVKYHVMFSRHINEINENMDFPALYFVKCTDKISEKINDDYRNNKYSSYIVCSIVEPEGLNKLIKCKVIHACFTAVEEKVFLVEPEYLYSLSILLNAKLNIKYLDGMVDMAMNIRNKLDELKEQHVILEYENHVNLLLVNRTVDMFTPLLHFFTLRSVLRDMSYEESRDDPLYPELRNCHVAEVQNILQSYLKKINQTLDNIYNNDSNDISKMQKLTIDAPKNVEIKKAIQKYSKVLNSVFYQIKEYKDLIDSEQMLVTEEDKNGNKVTLSIDSLLRIIENKKYSSEDRRRFFYLIKMRGIVFTKNEIDMLITNGIDKKDIELEVDLSEQIKLKPPKDYEYIISRYVPVLRELIVGYTKEQSYFKTIDIIKKIQKSLRKSFMLSNTNSKVRDIVIVYIKGGICEEECKLAYHLTKELGIEIICGSDKILTSKSFIESLKNTN